MRIEAYLRKVAYQLGVRVKSLVPCFHKSDHKSRGLNLESTRLTDHDRIERLLIVVTLANLWIMEVGVFVLNVGHRRQVYNRGASCSASLCQIGLRRIDIYTGTCSQTHH